MNKFRLWFESQTQAAPKIIDTATVTPDDQWRLGNAAIAGEGELYGYHVTSNPDKIMDAFKGPKKLTATYGFARHNELGPGLYISAVPHFWMGRAPNKFDFLKDLEPTQKQILANAILKSPAMTQKSYLSDGEKAGLQRDVQEFLNGNWQSIISLSGQPYNIRFWEPQFLEPLGIEQTKQPTQILIHLKGKFVNLESHTGHVARWGQFIRAGYDGGFTKSGFSSNPELVVWRKEAITRFEPQ